MLYSEEIPDNLGIIFRKEYTDLRDSTVKDFEKYTGLKVDSQRNVVLPNNSIIMFRHIEELHNIQNVNLGWFAVEQADELDSDHEFFLLFGRLRRQVTPSDYFKTLGLPERSGFVIGNSGDHWGKPLWKDGKLEGSECCEANTWDNADILPKDFLDSLKVLEKTKPEIYRQFVMNDWNVTSDQFLIIKSSWFESLRTTILPRHSIRKIISCDPSLGGDECIIYVLENSKIIDEKIMHESNTMVIAGEILALLKKYDLNDVAIDIIGIGKGIADRLEEWKVNVIGINSAEKADDPVLFLNRRAEMWFYVAQQILNKNIEFPIDEELRKQLSNVRYKVLDSNGKIKLEPKQDTKLRLGRSPDRADAFVYGLWGQKNVEEFNPYQQVNISFDHQMSGGRAGY
jgi:hypothetical protein